MYRYTATDPRGEHGRYFYAPFEGAAFLGWYRADRAAAIDTLAARSLAAGAGAGDAPRNGRAVPAGADPAPGSAGDLASVPLPGSATADTARVLAATTAADADPAIVGAWLDVLVRKVEVSRRLRAAYGPDLRPASDAEASPDAYAALARLLAAQAAGTGEGVDVGLCSSLLKVTDLLAWLARAEPAGFSARGAALAAEAMRLELGLVDAVERRGIPGRVTSVEPLAWAAGEPPVPEPGVAAEPGAGRVILLAADTARARAYLDLLATGGLLPDAAILVEPGGPTPAAPRPTPLFDNLTPIGAALARAGVPAERIAIERLDDPAVLAVVGRSAEDLVIVAPPAGALLSPAFFGPGAPRYLHVHPGRLPAYRGSTPMYYELLREGRLTATALLLDEGIDTGAVVAARGFLPPADLATIDGAFDPWMRAALLRDVLAARALGRPLAGRPQRGEHGRTYFVVHPVLRHVALLADAATAAPLPRPGAVHAGARA